MTQFVVFLCCSTCICVGAWRTVAGVVVSCPTFRRLSETSGSTTRSTQPYSLNISSPTTPNVAYAASTCHFVTTTADEPTVNGDSGWHISKTLHVHSKPDTVSIDPRILCGTAVSCLLESSGLVTFSEGRKIDIWPHMALRSIRVCTGNVRCGVLRCVVCWGVWCAVCGAVYARSSGNVSQDSCDAVTAM